MCAATVFFLRANPPFAIWEVSFIIDGKWLEVLLMHYWWGWWSCYTPNCKRKGHLHVGIILLMLNSSFPTNIRIGGLLSPPCVCNVWFFFKVGIKLLRCYYTAVVMFQFCLAFIMKRRTIKCNTAFWLHLMNCFVVWVISHSPFDGATWLKKKIYGMFDFY